MKLKINERFVARIIGEDYFQKFNVLKKYGMKANL